MRRKPFAPLNSAFVDTPLSKLVEMIEQACVFEAPELEAELDARLERIGKRWRFVRPGKIELYFPSKTRREQKLCDVGLFDTDARSQVDLVDRLKEVCHDVH